VQAIDMNGPAVGGLFATSHVPTQLGSDVFDSVHISNEAEAAPTACPMTWNCGDIGYPTPPGRQFYNTTTGTWTVEGGGFDIFLNVDQFHYVWRTLTGDGSISARLSSQMSQLFNPSAKAGLMMRGNGAPDAPYYAILTEPGNIIQIQWRVKQGGTTGEYRLPASISLPVYLRILRYGNTFTAYLSRDGIVWTLIPGSTETLNVYGPLMAGLAVTSHTPAALNIVTFDSVDIQ
jgi:hypothetical protein